MIVHLTVAVSLFLSFEQAPFRHIHKSDLHHEHAHGLAHVHLQAEQSEGQVIHDEDHDSDAQMLDWLAGDGTSPIKVSLSVPEAIAVPTIVIVAERVTTGETHNHDPPQVARLFLRGPPV